jgi:hypothetical protein
MLEQYFPQSDFQEVNNERIIYCKWRRGPARLTGWTSASRLAANSPHGNLLRMCDLLNQNSDCQLTNDLQTLSTNELLPLPLRA